MHSTPKPISDNDICCFGDRKTGLLPVPIIRRSIDSFDKSGNRNSLSISAMFKADSSFDSFEEIKQGLFNFEWERVIVKLSYEIMVFWLEFCWVNSINILRYLNVGIL